MMSRTIQLAALAVTALMTSSMFLGSGVAQQPPELTDAEVQRFLDTWLPRLGDEAYMTEYLNSEVQAFDGFNQYLEPDRARLVYTLVDAFEAANPKMAQYLNDPTLNAEQAELRHNVSIGILYMAIFDKAAFAEQVLKPLKAAGADEPDRDQVTQDVGQSEFFAGMTFDDITAHFENQQSALAEGSPLPTEVVPDPATLPGLDEATADAGKNPPEVLRYLELQDVQPETTIALEVPELPPVPVDLLEVPPLEVPELPAELPAVEPPVEVLMAVEDVLSYVIGTATYRVCWSYAGGEMQCTIIALTTPALPGEIEALGLPLPEVPDAEAEVPAALGAPAPVDVDGDGVPDITVTLAAAPAVDPESLQPGVQVLFRVERINPLLATLPLEVQAHYQLPGLPEVPATARPYAVLGFASADLPRLSALTATIADLLTPEVDLGVALTTGDARMPLTLLGGTYSVRLVGDSYEPYDPTLARITLSPTPETLNLDLDQDHQAVLEGGQSVIARVLDMAATTSGATRIDMDFVAQVGASADVIEASIADLPLEVSRGG